MGSPVAQVIFSSLAYSTLSFFVIPVVNCTVTGKAVNIDDFTDAELGRAQHYRQYRIPSQIRQIRCIGDDRVPRDA